MSKCYICDHEIAILCARRGVELIVVSVEGTDLPSGTEVQVKPCECQETK
jgi:hypothetical protein